MDAIHVLSYSDMLATGISGRQLDYWTRKGYLQANDSTPGTGNARYWLPRERLVADLMTRFIQAGITVEAAARIARDGVERGVQWGYLADEVLVYWGKGAPRDLL